MAAGSPVSSHQLFDGFLSLFLLLFWEIELLQHLCWLIDVITELSERQEAALTLPLFPAGHLLERSHCAVSLGSVGGTNEGTSRRRTSTQAERMKVDSSWSLDSAKALIRSLSSAGQRKTTLVL